MKQVAKEKDGRTNDGSNVQRFLTDLLPDDADGDKVMSEELMSVW